MNPVFHWLLVILTGIGAYSLGVPTGVAVADEVAAYFLLDYIGKRWQAANDE